MGLINQRYVSKNWKKTYIENIWFDIDSKYENHGKIMIICTNWNGNNKMEKCIDIYSCLLNFSNPKKIL